MDVSDFGEITHVEGEGVCAHHPLGEQISSIRALHFRPFVRPGGT